jgi:hypothetical protein
LRAICRSARYERHPANFVLFRCDTRWQAFVRWRIRWLKWNVLQARSSRNMLVHLAHWFRLHGQADVSALWMVSLFPRLKPFSNGWSRILRSLIHWLVELIFFPYRANIWIGVSYMRDHFVCSFIETPCVSRLRLLLSFHNDSAKFAERGHAC